MKRFPRPRESIKHKLLEYMKNKHEIMGLRSDRISSFVLGWLL
ncbi:hypothetical protein EV194_105275 [Natronoflexus pectinivorans]|uniref:Uncharacterized protein n=1 Tax=Natronoflexus pectinivorans TaxID=682526 RepID=A0A4V2RWH6_9BACT|nr:hypothetical protein EV194_105275 [Natronoflexus pectinivorans]